jgi:sugar lactone lactonase YvrE
VVKLTSGLVYSSQWGTTGVAGNDTTHANFPRWIDVDNTGGYLYVSDTNNHRVVKLTLLMVHNAEFGAGSGVAGGHDQGTFYPSGVCVVRNSGPLEGVWVSDANGRVMVLDFDVAFVTQLGHSYSFWTSGLWDTQGMAVDSSGNYYVAYSSRQEVVKYNSDHHRVATFGKYFTPLPDNAHVNRPLGIAHDATNSRLYVCDYYNHRVIALDDTTMKWGGQFGVTGATTGYALNDLCSYPVDVDVGSSGNVYIAQDRVHVVTKINSSFVLQNRFGKYGRRGWQGNDELSWPRGIAVKGTGAIVQVACDSRIMVLNGSLAYQSEYTADYDLGSLKKEAWYPIDILWSNSDSRWYVLFKERNTGSGLL